MKIILYIIFLFFTLFTLGQSINNDSLNLKSLNKNISAYRFYYSNYLGCHNNPLHFLDKYLLDEDELYDLSISKVKLPYFNLDDITLFEVEINNYSIIKKEDYLSRKKEIYFSDGISHESILSKLILVGLSHKKNKLIFFSGNVFKTCISNRFQLDVESPNTFVNFLKVKLFNYRLKDLSYRKKRRGVLIYKAFSDSLKENVLIKVDRKDYDDIQVKCIDNNWTERGAYQWR